MCAKYNLRRSRTKHVANNQMNGEPLNMSVARLGYNEEVLANIRQDWRVEFGKHLHR